MTEMDSPPAAAPGSSRTVFVIVASTILLAAATLTGWGLVQLAAGTSPRLWHLTETIAVLAAIGLPLAVMVASAFTRHWKRGILIACLGVALVTYGPTILLILAFFILGCIGLGRSVFRIDLSSTESALLAFAAGFGLLGVFIGYTASYKIHYDFVYGGILLAAVFVSRRALLRWVTAASSAMWFPAAPEQDTPVLSRLAILVPISVGMLLALHASSPEIGFDAMTTHYHFFDVLRTHAAFAFDTSASLAAYMPKTTVWALAVSDIFGGELAVRALHATLPLIVAGLVVSRASGLMGPGPASLLVATLLSAPVVLWISSQLFEEGGTMLLITASAIFFLRGSGSDATSRQADILSLALLGMAVSSKVQALFFGVLGVIIILRRFHISGVSKQSLISLVVGCGLFLLMAAGPYARAFLATGNPFFPFTPGQAIDPRWEHPVVFSTPYDMIFNTSQHMEAFPGGFALQFLLLLAAGGVALVANRWRSFSSIALVGLVFCFALANQTVYARYQLYVFPLLMLCLAGMYPSLATWGRTAISAVLLLIVPLNVALWRNAAVPAFEFIQLIDPTYSSVEPAEKTAFAVINVVRDDSTFVYIAGNFPFVGGLEAPFYANSHEAHVLHSAPSPEALAQALLSSGVTHIVLNGAPRNPHLAELCAIACTPVPGMPDGLQLLVLNPNSLRQAVESGSLATEGNASEQP